MKLVSRKSSSSPWSSGRNGGRCADYNTPLIIGRYWTLFYSVTSVFNFLLLGLSPSITLQPRLPQPATRTKCTAHAHQTRFTCCLGPSVLTRSYFTILTSVFTRAHILPNTYLVPSLVFRLVTQIHSYY